LILVEIAGRQLTQPSLRVVRFSRDRPISPGSLLPIIAMMQAADSPE
jgi:hypothetical protein